MRGRKAKLDRPIPWKIHIPSSVANSVTEVLRDPFTGAPPLGSRSELITRLLREWLADSHSPEAEVSSINLSDLLEDRK